MKSVVCIVLVFFSIHKVTSQNYIGEEKQIKQILENVKNFSKYVMEGDHKMIGESYTDDAKIFPSNMKIIEGKQPIINYWMLPEGVNITYHKIFPKEIEIIENTAYDYGTYEGVTKRSNGDESKWKGKYVIVWKKVGMDWKIYLDIWNKIK